MAQRQRGLGRGLGALIPSAQSEETNEQKGSVSRETGAQRNDKAGAQSHQAEKLESKAATKAATAGRKGQKSGTPKTGDSASNRTSKPSVAPEKGKKRGQSRATTEKAATPRPAKASARSSATESSDVSRGTSKKNKAPRADMGAALRASRTGGRATDVFFQTTQAQQAAEQHSETSQVASSSQGPEVSRETEAGTADAPKRSEEASGRNDTTPQKSAKSESPSERFGQGNEISASRETAAEDAESISEQSENKAAEESNGSVSRETATTGLPEGDEGPGSSHEQEQEDRKEADRPSDDENNLVPVPGAFFGEIKVENIHPNRKQPRHEFDEDEMEELVHSIKEIGVLQPIVIRPSREENDAKYELVMGERRWRATQRAGLSVIPAIVRETQDVDLLRDALLENLHRSQLNPLEEAAAYQQLLHEFGTTQDELAQRIGRSRPQISNTIRLLKLPALVQRRVAAGILSAGHARALLGLSDPAAMERLAQRIVAEGLSVRSVEEIIQSGGAESGKKAPRKSTPATKHHERFDYIADAFADKLDTNVKINVGARKGKMTIEFASVDDLNRIISVLDPEIERN